MKTLHYSIIVIVMIFSASIAIISNPVFAYDVGTTAYGGLVRQNQKIISSNTAGTINNVEIQNIQVQPSTIKVGDKLTITATLVNNSPNPIFVESGACAGPLYVTFDNHITINTSQLTCTLQLISKKLDPGKQITGTSPHPIDSYKATSAGTTNVTASFTYFIQNQTDPSYSRIQKTVSKSFLFTINEDNTQTIPVNPNHSRPAHVPQYPTTPLQQFKSGISAYDARCSNGYTLTIKSEDGSPACVKPDTVSKLVERGWVKQALYNVDRHVKPKITLYDYYYDGIDKDSAVISINNQTYYQTTLNYTVNNLKKDTSIQFHNVTFAFPEGVMITPGSSMTILDIKFPDNYEEIYGKRMINPDGSGSGSGIGIPSQFGPPAMQSITVLSNHVMPQAGLTIFHDKIKLLVSTGINSRNVQMQTSSCLSQHDSQTIIPGRFVFPGCGIILFNTNTDIIAKSGFVGVYRYANSFDDYVMEPGHNGTITYTITANHPQYSGPVHGQTPHELNITNYATFFHQKTIPLVDIRKYPEIRKEPGGGGLFYSTCYELPDFVGEKSCYGTQTTGDSVSLFFYDHPGVDVSFDKKSETIGFNGSDTVTMTISVSPDAPKGTYWMIVSPGICMGGEVILLTIGDCPYSGTL